MVKIIRGACSCFKCLSPASMMRPLQIIADPLKMRGQVQGEHPIDIANSKLNEEIEEEVGDLIALPFSR